MATMSTATQQPSASEAPAAAASGGAAATQHNGSARSSGCPPHVLEAIYGKKTKEEKQAALDHSLQRWWMEYADRKNDEEDEYVANSLLYDRRHLPRTAPAPECVTRAAEAARAAAAAAQPAAPQPAQP